MNTLAKFQKLGETLNREEMKNLKGGVAVQIWNCSCNTGSIDVEQCTVTGNNNFDYQFVNCCGYSGPVSGGHSVVDMCQAASNNY